MWENGYASLYPRIARLGDLRSPSCTVERFFAEMEQGGTMKTYTVRCEWDSTGWWVVTVPELPGAVSQARRLDQVSGDVAEVVELMTGEKPGTYVIEIETV
jgi:predicted RNase H-like HicB family nuclease